MSQSSANERHGVIAVIRRNQNNADLPLTPAGALADSAESPDRFLVIRRSQTVSAPGTYCFPGGGVEQGETESDALPRELKEELNIVKPQLVKRIWHSRSRRRVQLAWWTVDIDEATENLVADPAEVAEVHWWTAAEMRATGKLLDSNEEFLQHWEAGKFV